jgi:hypothetical protein
VRRWVTSAGRSAAAPLTYLVLAVLAHLPAFLDLARRTPCSCRDHPQTDWFLAWTPHALLAGQAPWTTTHLALPDGVNLMWNTLMPLPGLLMAPITLTAGPLATHTVLAVIAFAGSASSMWWVARRWARWWFARFTAGLLYGFSPYLVAQGTGHLNLELVMLPPVVLLLGDEILVRQRRRSWLAGGLLGLVTLAQLLTAEEVLASSFVVAAAGVVVLAVQQRRRLDRRRFRHSAIGLGTAATVLAAGAAWPLSVQFFGAGRVTAPVQDASPYAADVLGTIVPTVHQLLGTTWTSGWGVNDSENGSYLGLPLVLVLLLFAWRYRTLAFVRFTAGLGTVAWLLSLGERLHVAGHAYDVPMPFLAVSAVPVLHNLSATRLSLYVVLAAALLLAVGLDRAHAEGWFGRHHRLAVLAAGLCALPLLPSLPYKYVDARTPSYFTSDAVKRIPDGGVAFTYPVPRFPNSAPMDWQALSGFRYRSLGGYVITPRPDGKGTFKGGVSVWELVVGQAADGKPLDAPPQVQRRMLAEMTQWHVRAVLVADRPGADAVEQLVEQVLGRPADERVGGVAAWYLTSGPAAGPLAG